MRKSHFVISAAVVLAMITALYAHDGGRPPRSATLFATIIANVVNDEAPPNGVKKIEAASWLVVTGYDEGRFALHARRGDGGKSVCTFQVKTRRRRHLEASPAACVRAAYAAMRESVRVCPTSPLAQYAGGCHREAARIISARRIERAIFDTL